MTDNTVTDTDSTKQALLTTLDSVVPVVTMSHEELVVIALGAKTRTLAADYLTLADTEAPPTGFEFTELGTGGSVPTVQVKVGLKPLLVVAGETIVGGKQNRVINVTLWLGAKKTTPIPVTCLEHGRWNSGYRFGAGPTVDLDFRAKFSRMVNEDALAGRPGFHSDQGAVWREISEKERLHARRSATGALHDLYATETANLDDIVASFPMPEGASGIAVGIGGKLVAVDLFDSPTTLRRQWQRLITSAATALIDYRHRVGQGWLSKQEHRYPDESALGRMLERAKKSTADATVRRSVGEGWDVRLQTRKLHGSALVHENRVVHVALFRDEPPRPPSRPAPRQEEPPTEDWSPPEQRTRQGLAELMRRLQDDSVRVDPPEPEPAGVPARPRRNG